MVYKYYSYIAVLGPTETNNQYFIIIYEHYMHVVGTKIVYVSIREIQNLPFYDVSIKDQNDIFPKHMGLCQTEYAFIIIFNVGCVGVFVCLSVCLFVCFLLMLLYSLGIF